MKERGIVFWVMLSISFIAVLKLPDSVTNSAKIAARESISPLHELVTGFSNRVRNTFRSIQGWGGLVDENQQLAREIVEMKSQIHELESLKTENVELRKKLSFKQHTKRELIAAEVIARDISGWWQTIRLDKGYEDGARKDLAVVTDQGLVGRVKDVTARTCDVLLISDPNCKVSCIIPRNSGFGVLSGKGLSLKGEVLATLSLINRNLDVEKHDPVVTSGMGGIFPKGILVGHIEDIDYDSSGLFKKADILPMQDLGSITYVFIIASESGDDVAPMGGRE